MATVRREERDSKIVSAQAERQRKEANLCFKCGDKWEPGQVGFRMMEEDKEERQQESIEENSDVIEELELGDEELMMMMKVDLSLLSMAGVSGNAALKLYGHITHRRVTILVDSGTNSSFISWKLVKEL